MTIAAWYELIMGVLKFPDAFYKLLKVLQKTPQEKHDELIVSVNKASDDFKRTNRPTWG